MTHDEALHRAAAYCSQAEHCTFELTTKFNRWEVPVDEQRKILEYLKKENYLNNERYAIAFARDKFRYNKWGKIRLRMEMQRKELSADDIANALSVLDEDAYQQQATELATAKLKSLKYKDSYERDGKLYRFLAGRGFESDVIRQAIQSACKQD